MKVSHQIKNKRLRLKQLNMCQTYRLFSRVHYSSSAFEQDSSSSSPTGHNASATFSGAQTFFPSRGSSEPPKLSNNHEVVVRKTPDPTTTRIALPFPDPLYLR